MEESDQSTYCKHALYVIEAKYYCYQVKEQYFEINLKALTQALLISFEVLLISVVCASNESILFFRLTEAIANTILNDFDTR